MFDAVILDQKHRYEALAVVGEELDKIEVWSEAAIFEVVAVCVERFVDGGIPNFSGPYAELWRSVAAELHETGSNWSNTVSIEKSSLSEVTITQWALVNRLKALYNVLQTGAFSEKRDLERSGSGAGELTYGERFKMLYNFFLKLSQYFRIQLRDLNLYEPVLKVINELEAKYLYAGEPKYSRHGGTGLGNPDAFSHG